MKKKAVAVFQIAATYIGTVVGAGFASGQSIMQFFTVYGSRGTLGILVCTLLFMWLGTKMMILSHRIRAYSYRELNTYLFGPVFGKIANGLTFIILFGVTSVMLSGTGSIFQEQLGLPYQLGILASIGLSYLVMSRDIKGIIAVNALVAPLMVFFTIFLAVSMLDPASLARVMQPGAAPDLPGRYKWAFDSLAYASLNFAFVQAVIVPLGSEAEDESTLKWGGFWGGAGLGIMLLVSHFALTMRMPDIMRYEVPMAEIIREFGPFMHALFLTVIYGEIFTTLIGNVFGITRQIRSLCRLPVPVIVFATLLGCFLISQIGFASLVDYLYPLFGYMGLILVLLLGIRRIQKE
ncbi:hypothetical protein [Paenibacillus humicola]|uniref:YkvI family membrane protein n=1 Tax=Paenibacillus humicola TaxID=3110540 RepID=UPI00237BE5C9|nr:hypothetical protein [Paenibacillus humicola]